MIESRSGSWSVRFRLPPAIQEQYNLPRLPRLITENIRGNLSDPKHRAIALRREANRIGAKLDLLLHGHDAPGPGETLAHWLGLAESKRIRHNSKRRVPRSKTWQYLAQLYIDEFKNSTIAREINEMDAVRRFERIRDLDFCQDRFPPDINAKEWDEYFDGLMRDRPTSGGGKTTSLVLDAARSLIAKNGRTNASELALHLKSQVKRQSLDKHIAVLIRDGFLRQQMQAMRNDLKRQIRMLTKGPRFDEPFVLWVPTSSAKTVNKVRALVRRTYDLGIRHRMFRDNTVLSTVKRTAGRRYSSKPCYRTKSLIEEELDRRNYSTADKRRMYRYRVLDHQEQADLIRLATERAERKMLEPVICGMHGVSGVDLREMLKGGYNARTGIVSGQRAKTGQAKFAVPIGVDLCSSWCVGYELIRIKAKLGLKGLKWDAYCKKVLPFSSRQARDYKALAKAYGSAEEMMEGLDKPENKGISFANAVLQARAVLNPDRKPELNSGNKHEDGRNENEPVTIKPQGDQNGPTAGDRKPPVAGSDGARMLDDIQRIATNLADDLILLGKVHAILVKAEAKAAREAVSTEGRGESKAKVKSRKPAARKKRGKVAK